jgi:hypothetical protein
MAAGVLNAMEILDQKIAASRSAAEQSANLFSRRRIDGPAFLRTPHLGAHSIKWNDGSGGHENALQREGIEIALASLDRHRTA